jgi:hypothetical protein
MTNKIYYGDNLDVLRRYIKDESVDLCYIDPILETLALQGWVSLKGFGVFTRDELKPFL